MLGTAGSSSAQLAVAQRNCHMLSATLLWRWLCIAAACVFCTAEQVSVGRHLAAGAIARAISIATLYPVDTIKTRVQLAQLPTVPSIGLLFKGLTSSLAGQIPYAALSFGCYESYKGFLLARMPKSMSLAAVSLAAVAGDLTGSIWLVPSEVIKQLLQAGRYTSMREAVRTIYSAEGAKGFYRGYSSQVARDVPFRVIQLVSYEYIKSAWLARTKHASSTSSAVHGKRHHKAAVITDSVELSSKEAMVVGALAGTISAALTTPFDVLKTAMMTSKDSRSLLSTARALGPTALFRGITQRVFYIAPSCAIFFLVYETVKNAQ
eukprot:20371-Heterococcus_DN1.PRE.2